MLNPTAFIVKAAAPLPKITEYQRYLFIGPHPDDIEVGAGATAARLAAEGKRICFLICTDGRYGTDEIADPVAPEELAERRRNEALSSAAMLGVKDVRFLNFCDGGFYAVDEMIASVAEVIGDFQPDVVFAPDPDVSSECHIDHLNVGRAAKQLALFSENSGIMERYGAGTASVQLLALYMTAKVSQYVGTTGYMEKQLSALFDCHNSQFPAGSSSAKSIRTYLKLRATDFGVRSRHKTAEGFRILDRTRMHCLPEAGN